MSLWSIGEGVVVVVCCVLALLTMFGMQGLLSRRFHGRVPMWIGLLTLLVPFVGYLFLATWFIR